MIGANVGRVARSWRSDGRHAETQRHGLGSTTGLADASGAVTGTYTYDAFGAQRSHTGASANEFTYTGEQHDPTGLEYLRARYYDASTGRFVSRDPLPLVQRYAYVGANPVNYVDPTGEDGGKPTPVPLPPAGTDDLYNRCEMGWINCVDRIAPAEQRRQGGSMRYYVGICNDFLRMCTRHASGGDPNTYFDFDGARQRMRAMSVTGTGRGSLLSRSLEAIGRRLRRLRLPSTGSGGYLGREDQSDRKEGGFGCLP